jgi:NTE family protein
MNEDVKENIINTNDPIDTDVAIDDKINIEKIDTLVLSGGGVKGIAYVGVFKRLRELGIKVKEICTVSVGSIMGLLYVLGYDYEELVNEINMQNMDTLRDINIGNFLNKYGIDSGKNILKWLEKLLEGKGYNKDITFMELYIRTGIKYRVLATNLNKYETMIFDYTSCPNMKITRAIRMSIGIPFVFTVQKYKGDVHVDGAIVNNYPIDLYSDRLESVLGMNVVTSVERGEIGKVNQVISDISGYIFNVMNCFLVHRSKLLLSEYKMRTLSVMMDKMVSTMSFNISNEEKEMLIECGYKSACEFFTEKV